MAKDSDNTFANSFFSSYLENFFFEELRNIFCAEDFARRRLPEIQNVADSPRLRMAIEELVRLKSIHLSNLEEIFEILRIEKGDKNIYGIKSILEEVEQIDQKTKPGTTARDMAIILSIQKILHYGIASYSGLIHLTKSLDFSKVTTILNQILSEENESDKLFKSIVSTVVNHEDSDF